MNVNSGRSSHNPPLSRKTLGLTNRSVFRERNPLGWREVAVMFNICVFLKSHTLYTRILESVMRCDLMRNGNEAVVTSFYVHAFSGIMD
jgi:hypothetical protein